MFKSFAASLIGLWKCRASCAKSRLAASNTVDSEKTTTSHLQSLFAFSPSLKYARHHQTTSARISFTFKPQGSLCINFKPKPHLFCWNCRFVVWHVALAVVADWKNAQYRTFKKFREKKRWKIENAVSYLRFAMIRIEHAQRSRRARYECSLYTLFPELVRHKISTIGASTPQNSRESCKIQASIVFLVFYFGVKSI